MRSAAKLGTRVVVAATIATTATLAIATTATRASGAARVEAFTHAGAPAFAGDGGPARAATLASPAGVAVDTAGDVAIADTGNCRVRYVPATPGRRYGVEMRSGDIYTIAGSTCGYSGDSGRATSARLSFPTDVAFDAAGNVFVSDTGNNEIRMISPAGEISSAAGSGTQGFSGDHGLSTAAALNGPSGITVDPAGDLYIADTNNCRVREVPTRNGITALAPIAGDISTVAGDGTCGDAGAGGAATHAELFTPDDVALDARGDLFVADTGNRVVREVAASAGTNFGIAMTPGRIYTVAGSGTYNPYFGDGLAAVGDASSLSYPTGIALDAAGDLFVADTYARGVREIPAAAGAAFGTVMQPDTLYTLAGAGRGETPTAGGTAHDPVVYPSRIALSASGAVFVADIGNNRVELLRSPPG